MHISRAIKKCKCVSQEITCFYAVPISRKLIGKLIDEMTSINGTRRYLSLSDTARDSLDFACIATLWRVSNCQGNYRNIV